MRGGEGRTRKAGKGSVHGVGFGAPLLPWPVGQQQQLLQAPAQTYCTWFTGGRDSHLPLQMEVRKQMSSTEDGVVADGQAETYGFQNLLHVCFPHLNPCITTPFSSFICSSNRYFLLSLLWATHYSPHSSDHDSVGPCPPKASYSGGRGQGRQETNT